MCIYQTFKNDIEKNVQILYVDLPKVGLIVKTSYKEGSCNIDSDNKVQTLQKPGKKKMGFKR